MGLDSYVKGIPAADVVDDFKYLYEHEHHEIAYWRKNYDLHNFFKQRYLQRGGTDNDFNCSPIRITQSDLNALKDFLRVQPEDDEYTLEFVYQAQRHLDDGTALYFSSWY